MKQRYLNQIKHFQEINKIMGLICCYCTNEMIVMLNKSHEYFNTYKLKIHHTM